ncbi:conserved hypothetical protein [Ignisphaera aggregans DSM 17230]|uniref:Uncharacterized protein n=1 Tax=Ignisphaera aggregans (strain DSM 17230 / JCM 13409 / AQ1.S1) TaxID=583356 RepID=E0SRZ5_IGNAA|nr:conserved hypothetical protein [Ignisphaera aggregans DSM 17230]
MNRRLISFSLILLTLLTVATLAMWSETLRVNVAVGTGEVDWEIVSGPTTWLDACGLQPGYGYFRGNDWNASYLPEPGADQLDKDVGCTDVTLIDSDGDGDYDTMRVTLYNVYPWYYTHIAFKVHNDGTIPIKIWRIIIDNQEFYELNAQPLKEGLYLDLTGDGKSDVLIWWGDNFGVQLHPCQSADISLDITVLQDAPQGSTLSFTVSFEAIQWNEYYVPS